MKLDIGGSFTGYFLWARRVIGSFARWDMLTGIQRETAEAVVVVIAVVPADHREVAPAAAVAAVVVEINLRLCYAKNTLIYKPSSLVPGKPEELTIDLHSINHTFKKGHKLMVQIQSSWFPLIDRNPQKYVPTF